MTFVKIPKSMLDKADQILSYFTIYSEEPNQEVYFSKNVPFSVEPILNNSAIYCIQTSCGRDAGAVIVGEDNTFLITGHTRKGKNYLIDKWVSGERSNIGSYVFS